MFQEGSGGRAAEAARLKRLALQLPVEISGRSVGGAEFVEQTRSLNISGGGLLLELGHRVEVGETVQLRIELPPKLRPHFGGQPEYRCRAVVCRVEPAGPQGRFRLGARFLAAASG
jgi:hypothetical protein